MDPDKYPFPPLSQNIETEYIKEGIHAVIDAFIDFAVGSGVNTSSPSALHEAAREFAQTQAIADQILGSQEGEDEGIQIAPYCGDITTAISDILDQYKRNGVSPMSVYESQEDFRTASTRYAQYLVPIVLFEQTHNFDIDKMRDAATDDLNLIEHVLAGIQRFPNMDPLGVALQVFKKGVLDL